MATADLKETASHLEDSLPGNMGVSEPDPSAAAINKRIARKVDWRLIPILAAVYTMSLVDRTNLGGARISGIDQAIGLNKGTRYSLAVLIFYVSYILGELPSNIMLKKLGAGTWISLLSLAFGLITIGIGLIKNYASLVVLRFMLGALEAGIFPGCIYLISSWYQRYAVQKRLAVFFTVSSFVSSFANILAYGLTQIADHPETGGWRYIFILQGSITIAIAIVAYFVIVDFPESNRNKFLSSDEKEVLINRLVAERGDAEAGKVTWKVFKDAVSDWHTWTITLMYMSGSCGLYGFLFFLPIILRASLGYSMVASFCLTAPPAAFATLFTLVIAWLADKTKVRGPYVCLSCIIAVVGLAMTGFLKDPIPRYIGTFLGEAGTNTIITTTLAWGQNQVVDDAKRSVVTVIQVFGAAIGGIYSALVFRSQDAPDYVPGIVALGALCLAAGVLAPITSFFLWRKNKRIDRGEIIGENSPGFRYTW